MLSIELLVGPSVYGGLRMASLKELTATLSSAVGHRRYLLPSMALAIGALLDFVMLKFGLLIDPNGPFAFLPFAIGVAVAASLILWWLLGYAADSRSELRGIVNLEKALDGLSTYFDEGTQIFEAAVTDDSQYADWDVRRLAWCERVQEHLLENFGLRERNLFRNVVLVQPLTIQGSYNVEHNRRRCLIVQQLDKIRDAIVRYSDLAAKRRADSY
jgi:hypothetical protein